MIAFRDEGSESKTSSEESIKDALQKLLDIIYDDPEYYPGSFHEDLNISDVIDLIYKILYADNNKSLHLIIDKKSNNSIDITVDKIE
tara:strand:- start:3057 stop:3317 length:261 start_codon:yes stop_codon:yes gene_type:complete